VFFTVIQTEASSKTNASVAVESGLRGLWKADSGCNFTFGKEIGAEARNLPGEVAKEAHVNV
jgi:hypothetical protein